MRWDWLHAPVVTEWWPACLHKQFPSVHHRGNLRKPQLEDVHNLINFGPTKPIQILNQHESFWRFCMCPSNDTFDKNKKSWSRYWGSTAKTGSLLGIKQTLLSNPKVNRGCAPLTANRTSADCVQISLGPSTPYIPLGDSTLCLVEEATSTKWYLRNNENMMDKGIALTQEPCLLYESAIIFHQRHLIQMVDRSTVPQLTITSLYPEMQIAINACNECMKYACNVAIASCLSTFICTISKDNWTNFPKYGKLSVYSLTFPPLRT